MFATWMIKSRMSWVEYVVRIDEMKNAYIIFVGEPERKRSLDRPGCRWVDNKMQLK
jgi:hypothetical protein